MRKNELIGVECDKCEDIIWSRKRRDKVYCQCKRIYIDGGSKVPRTGAEYRDGKFATYSLIKLTYRYI